jgi:hypothetical protein
MRRDDLGAFLYGAEACVILAASDSRCGAELAELTETTVLVFDSATLSLRGLVGHGVCIDGLLAAPSCPFLLMAQSASGRTELERLRTWWHELSPDAAPEIESLPGAFSIERAAISVLRHFTKLARADRERSAHLAMDAHKQLLCLRMTRETDQHLISHLSSLIEKSACEPRIVCSPVEAVFSSPDPNPSREFDLAFSVWGLSRLDLHFVNTNATRGCLAIRMQSLEDENCIGSWRVPYESISGWLSLIFLTAVTAEGNFAKLTLQWQTESGSARPPQLSCSASKQIDLSLGSHLEQPYSSLPALRLWFNVPGSSRPAPFWTGTSEIPGREST